jgi:hypothetical protein
VHLRSIVPLAQIPNPIVQLSAEIAISFVQTHHPGSLSGTLTANLQAVYSDHQESGAILGHALTPFLSLS